MPKIALGTVQFGLDYGISNIYGKTDKQEVSQILEHASNNLIDLIDTASMYGNSEEIIGKSINNLSSWKIVTKTPHFNDIQINPSHAKSLSNFFRQSLIKLNRKKVYALLLHSCDDLLKPNGKLLFEEMQILKSQGFVKKIGVSLYDEYQIEKILDKFDIDIIQLPFNILDQKLLIGGWLKKIKDNNIEIHARSPFLQGLLLMPLNSIPSYFSPIQHKFEMLQANADDLSVSKLDLLLSFVMSIQEIDQIIVGINNLSQLKEIIDIRKIKMNPSDYKNYAVDNPIYVNPSIWQL